LRRLNELRLIAQMGGTGSGSHREIGIVVEGLVVKLEVYVPTIRKARGRKGVGILAYGPSSVGPARRTDVAIRVRPAPSVPCSVDALIR
jgi:hypothetical protein